MPTSVTLNDLRRAIAPAPSLPLLAETNPLCNAVSLR